MVKGKGWSMPKRECTYTVPFIEANARTMFPRAYTQLIINMVRNFPRKESARIAPKTGVK